MINNIKLVTLHLLVEALTKYHKVICYGCEVNYPSQLQHSCVFEILEFFYKDNCDEIMNWAAGWCTG